MDKEKLLESKENLIHALANLENCWGHHGDGSDLLVSQSHLFDIMYHSVMKRLSKVLIEIDKELGESQGKTICNLCGLKTNPGGPCGHCGEIRHRVDHEHWEWRRAHGSH